MIWMLVVFLGTAAPVGVGPFQSKPACEAALERVRPRLVAVSTPAERRGLRLGCYRAIPLAHGDPRST